MAISSAVAPMAEGRSAVPAHGQAQLRVGIVSDFLEEKWPSMDLVSDMLSGCLQSQPDYGILATQLRPSMRRAFSRVPFLAHNGLMWNADRLWNRFVEYSRWLKRHGNDLELFHLVDHSYSQLVPALPAGRSVVTCHDLDTFRCLLEPERAPRSRWFRAMTQRILDGFRQAAHVIAVSSATREELTRFNLIPAERITLIPNGVHPSCSPEPNPQADEAARRLLGFGTHNPLLLSVGNTLPRKRLDLLLKIFAEVQREMPAARLVRVGGFTDAHWQLVRELKLEPAVKILPFLERDVLAAIYRRATVLLHTAEKEGFGLPVIEALACGCAAVVSDVPVLREVGGTATSYCGVGDIPAWKNRVLELLEQKLTDPEALDHRREIGLAWARGFSWMENARQTAEVYRKVLSSK